MMLITLSGLDTGILLICWTFNLLNHRGSNTYCLNLLHILAEDFIILVEISFISVEELLILADITFVIAEELVILLVIWFITSGVGSWD